MTLGMSLIMMDNGTHRATFSIDGSKEYVVVGSSRGQTLDLAFKEIRKIMIKTASPTPIWK